MNIVVSYFQSAKNSLKGALDRDFLQKIMGTFLTQILSLGINVLSVIYLSRSLGPISRGIHATVMGIITLGIQFGNMGLHASNTYFISMDRNNFEKTVGNSCLIALIWGGMISIGVFTFFAFNFSQNSIRWIDLFLISFWIPVGLAYLLFQNVLISIHEVKAYNKAEIFNKGVGFLANCCFFFFGFRNVEMILIVTFFAQILALIYVWMRIKAHLINGVSTSISLLKKCVQYGFKSYVSCFFVYLVLKIDLLMVKHLLGFEEVGYYSVATNMADLVYIYPTIVASLLFPRIVPIEDEMERWKVVRKIAMMIFLLMLVVGGISALVVKVVVVTLLGEAFSPAVPAFLYLLPGLIFLSVNAMFMNYFASLGFPYFIILSPGLAAITNVIMNLFMIPAYGIVGASVSSSFCYGGMFFLSLIYLRYKRRQYQKRQAGVAIKYF